MAAKKQGMKHILATVICHQSVAEMNGISVAVQLPPIGEVLEVS
jgi:hypothetical protein